jgi:hypothetical protein
MWVSAQRLSVERDVDGLEPAVGERLAHHRLPGLLVAERGRGGDETLEQLDHPVGVDVHRTLPSTIWRVFWSE